MKRVEYFNTKEELERYYENGVPSTVLAIVQPDAETPAVLYTSSNNSPINPGQTEEQGGEEQIDPYWGQGLDIQKAIEDDEFPVTGNICAPGISSDFEYEEENGEITSVSWNWVVTDFSETEYTVRVVVNSDNNLEGGPTGNMGMAALIAENLENYPDLYIDDTVIANLTDVTMTKSSDPSEDGYDYLLEGNLWAFNMMYVCDSVAEVTENGFYPVVGQMGFNVDVPSGIEGALLSDVFGADENDDQVYVEFDDEDDSFVYSFDCTWDGENWTGSLSNAGFALVGLMGDATQYDYDSESGEMVENPSYTAIQMHIANGALYLGDVFAANGDSLDDVSAEYPIAVDMWPNTKFLNNGFGAGPENLDMTGWASGTLTFTLTVPKNLAVNYDTGYDYIGDGEFREIVHPCVYLKWEWDGEPIEDEEE